MRTVRKFSKRTQKYIESLPVLYVIVDIARAGIQKYYFSGKYNEYNVPLVWDYNDHNGTADQYELISADRVTSYNVITWTFSSKTAERLLYYIEVARGICREESCLPLDSLYRPLLDSEAVPYSYRKEI